MVEITQPGFTGTRPRLIRHLCAETAIGVGINTVCGSLFLMLAYHAPVPVWAFRGVAGDLFVGTFVVALSSGVVVRALARRRWLGETWTTALRQLLRPREAMSVLRIVLGVSLVLPGVALLAFQALGASTVSVVDFFWFKLPYNGLLAIAVTPPVIMGVLNGGGPALAQRGHPGQAAGNPRSPAASRRPPRAPGLPIVGCGLSMMRDPLGFLSHCARQLGPGKSVV